MLTLMQATDIATNGNVLAQIRVRIEAGLVTDAQHARLMIEIAQLALAEAGRTLDDSDDAQEAIDAAMTALGGV